MYFLTEGAQLLAGTGVRFLCVLGQPRMYLLEERSRYGDPFVVFIGVLIVIWPSFCGVQEES